MVEDDGALRSEAELAVPAVPAGGSATVDLPAWDAADGAETWVTVRAELAADAPWAARGHVVSHTQFAVARPARPSHAPRQVRRSDQVCDAEFDERTGALRRLFGLDVDGPRLELWRAPTDNDRGIANDSPDGRSSESRWRERGLDRLVHRVVAVDPDGPVVRVRVGAADSARTVDVTYRWTVTDEVALRVEVVPSPDWDCTWPRVGVRFDLPPTLRRARWFGTGPHESYPDSRRAARVGRFAASLDELNVRYSRPQETGHRAELRTLEVGDDAGVRLRLRTIPGPGRPPPRVHAHRAHPAGAGPGPAPARAGRRRPARTCSSTTPCTGWGRRPAGWTSPRSTACGRGRGRSGSCSPRRDRGDGDRRNRRPAAAATALRRRSRDAARG